MSDKGFKLKAGETLSFRTKYYPTISGTSDTDFNWGLPLIGKYSEDGFMALYEVAIVTKDENGEKLAYGPKAVLAKTKEAAIALASAEAGAAVLGTSPQVLVRPFATGS